MIKDYVIKLIENLPQNIKDAKKCETIDLVLDGGAFNGSYLTGAVYFLQEMEQRKYIKINRISGCSIGSVIAFLYYIDRIDLASTFAKMTAEDFRQTHKLQIIKDIKNNLKPHIPDDVCLMVNHKLFITYHNIINGKKKVKSTYLDVDDILDTILKSCYLPFLIDGNMLYKNKYVDGINPYIFKTTGPNKILYLDLFGYDKIGHLFNVKNEKTDCHRILAGLLDIHSFFIKQSPTNMCSYVNEWNIINKGNIYFKGVLEKMLIYLIYIMYFIKNKTPNQFKNTICYKLSSKITQDICVILLDEFCL